MNTVFRVTGKFVIATVASMVSIGALAVPMTFQSLVISAGGSSIAYIPDVPPFQTVLLAKPPTTANINAALSGPGNVELGKFAGPVVTLNGYFTNPADSVALSGLTFTDWTQNADALANAYIAGAAASIGATLTPAQRATALSVFLTLDVGSGLHPYQLVSDPNVSDVNLINGHVVVGLDGLLDATSFLNALFAPVLPVGVHAPAGSQAARSSR